MRRMPLGFAVAIFILQLFLVMTNPEYFHEGIWITIGVNAVFIVIGIVKLFRDIDKY